MNPIITTAASAQAGCFFTSQQQLDDAIRTLQRSDISGYIQAIDTKDDWISFRGTGYPLNSASQQEARFNRSGESAYYFASGDETAKANVADWDKRLKCRVEPQQLNCFNLRRFAEEKGLSAQYRIAKDSGGYPLTQSTAEFLERQHGVSGLLYASATADGGCCIVLRMPSNEKVSDTFFRTGEASAQPD